VNIPLSKRQRRAHDAMQERAVNVFRGGSRTFYIASLFFPEATWSDVVTLYRFVRIADDFVDAVPQEKQGFRAFRAAYEASYEAGMSDFNTSRSGRRASKKPLKNRAHMETIEEFLRLERDKSFDHNWVIAFLDAMESDLNHTPCRNMGDTKKYMYGSAEVVGLMMANIMDLPRSALPYARTLGRAFQYINFIRDVNEDISLQRSYLPRSTWGSLTSLEESAARSSPTEFGQFMREQISQYRQWRDAALPGVRLIPWRERVAVVTAMRMFDWTATQIERDPFLVYRTKVRPSAVRVLVMGAFTMLTGGRV
jgi:phytoene synthase